MGAKVLGSRAIMGMYFRMLEQDKGTAWVEKITNLFDSDQAGEIYKFLGQSPVFREWLGGRKGKGLNDGGFEIDNKKFESTLNVGVDELRRDKTGQLLVRIMDHAQRANAHWASLTSSLILAGESTLCYDEQYFFDTDHSFGDSGQQSNSIQVDLSDLPATVHGTPAAPSPEEANQAILEGVTKICSFVDDQGEPMNENASSFLVMVPFSLLKSAKSGLTLPRGTDAAEQVADVQIEVVGNARLAPWTTKMAVFRTDSAIKPIIRQQETAVKVAAKGTGSEYEFDNDAHQYGMSANRNVGPGMWEHACLVEMVA